MMTETIKTTKMKGILAFSFLVSLALLFSCTEEIEGEDTIVIPPSPIAAFTEVVDVTDYRTYIFTDRSTNASTYAWDFGEGSSSTDAEPTHSFAQAGSYNVLLTVSNGSETTDTVEKTIVVTNPEAPVVGFTFLEDPNDWQVFTFTNTSTNAVSYSWDFGDNTTSTEESPTKTFATEGDFIVTLTATNDSGDSSELEQTVSVVDPNSTVTPTFKAIVQNGTGDDHLTGSTSDNADAWDMTPNSTVIDDVLGEIPSPYKALWSNSDLNSYIDATYCTNEQPGSTSDGSYVNGSKTRAIKIYQACRRLYQKLAVEAGVEYTFTIDSRSEVEGINSDVYILNTDITTEVGIENFADKHFEITNDFNSSKGSATDNTFTTNTFTFIPTTDWIVIYIKAPLSVDSSTEVFYDNIDIITPGFE